MTPDYLWLLATQILDLAEQSLDPDDTEQDAPDRVFIAHGQPVVEFCEGPGTLVVWYDTISTRQVGRSDAMQKQLVITFFIDLWRCWPVGQNLPPSVEVIEEAVRLQHIDVWCLVNGVQQGFDQIVGCELVQFQEVRTLGPLGGVAGWRMPVTVGLSGYTASLPS